VINREPRSLSNHLNKQNETCLTDRSQERRTKYIGPARDLRVPGDPEKEKRIKKKA
jgi:hypothetical protein